MAFDPIDSDVTPLSREEQMTLRKLLLGTALPVGFALAGCGPTTTTGGTTTKVTDAKGNTVTVDEKLSVNGPVGSPYTMKQGESKQLEFSLTRGKDLKDDVELHVEGADKDKVKVEVPKSVPASGDGKFTVKVIVPDDAAVAEHSVKLTAKTSKGPAATAEFKVKVDKK
jgi:uncharacterized membrane protein